MVKSILLKLNSLKSAGNIVVVGNESSVLAILKDSAAFSKDLPIITIHDGQSWLTRSDLNKYISHMHYPRFVVEDKGFSDRFKKRFGHDVQLTGSNAYDAAWSVLRAIQNGATDAKAIRDYLTSTELNTVTFGAVRLVDGHVGKSTVEMLEYKK